MAVPPVQVIRIPSIASYSLAQWMGPVGGAVTTSAPPGAYVCVRSHSRSTGVRARETRASGG